MGFSFVFARDRPRGLTPRPRLTVRLVSAFHALAHIFKNLHFASTSHTCSSRKIGRTIFAPAFAPAETPLRSVFLMVRAHATLLPHRRLAEHLPGHFVHFRRLYPASLCSNAGFTLRPRHAGALLSTPKLGSASNTRSRARPPAPWFTRSSRPLHWVNRSEMAH